MASGLGLLRVSAAGGTPQALTSLDPSRDEIGHDWPEILPGGKAVLFTVTARDQQIAVQSLETGRRQVVIRGGSHARYVPTGHLVYVRAGVLLAVPFDLARLEVRGLPVPILEDVMVTNFTAAQYCFSRFGLTVYIPVRST